VRDPETARIAVQAALTGHLVLSTLHTNDAPSRVVRLINIGVEPFLISAALNAILAQRLVRRICPNCAAPVDSGSAREMEYLTRIGRADMQLTRGKGCDMCRNTGYKGRVGLYELLVLSDQIRDLIPRNPSIMDLKRVACEEGMRTLQDDGLDKVALGRTTVEEIMRVSET
jgi:type IV pilus assembly protein PilB